MESARIPIQRPWKLLQNVGPAALKRLRCVGEKKITFLKLLPLSLRSHSQGIDGATCCWWPPTAREKVARRRVCTVQPAPGAQRPCCRENIRRLPFFSPSDVIFYRLLLAASSIISVDSTLSKCLSRVFTSATRYTHKLCVFPQIFSSHREGNVFTVTQDPVPYLPDR